MQTFFGRAVRQAESIEERALLEKHDTNSDREQSQVQNCAKLVKKQCNNENMTAVFTIIRIVLQSHRIYCRHHNVRGLSDACATWGG
jgi:hypothetical protein